MSPEVQILIFELERRLYGLRLSAVERVLRAVEVTPLPQTPKVVSGVIDVGGQIVPVLSLRNRLGLAERAVGVNDQFVLARTARRRIALVVDLACGVVEKTAADLIEAKTILPNLKQIEGIVQLDGGIVLIHDLDALLSLEEEQALARAMTIQANHGP
jgi:purine-binding chemotaxis protein CheW